MVKSKAKTSVKEELERPARRTHEEMEEHMKEVFRPMEHALNRYRGGMGTFGQGPSMHADARKAAPEWLQKWDDKHRWLICFTQGWEGLVSMASAFNWEKSMLLADLIYYEEKHAKETGEPIE